MRKIIVVVWLLLLITSMLGIQTDFVNAGNSEKTIFFDDFESYSLGSYPSSNWILDYDGAGEEYQKIVSNPVKSGSKAFQMLSAQGCWAAVSEHKFNSDAEVIGFEADVWAESYGTEGCGGDKTSVIRVAFWNGGLDSWGRYYADVIFRHNGIAYAYSEGEEHQLTSWEPKRWYHVKVILNRKTNTYDVYIDGKLVADDIPVEHSDTENINAIVLTAGHANTKVVFDNIRVFEVTSEPSEPSSSGTVDLSRGLVAYYSFDHCDARDDSGNGHDGEIYGNPKCIDGVLGKAFEFDGGSYVRITPSNELDDLSEFTISMLIRINEWWNDVHFGLIDFYNKNYDGGWGLEIFSSGERIQIYDYVPYRGFVRVPEEYTFKTGTWYFVTATYDGQNVTFYVNGKQIGTAKLTEKLTTPSDIYIGYNPSGGNEYNYGDFDEVRIYNRALSEEEVKALYEQGVGKVVEYLTPEDLSLWKYYREVTIKEQSGQTLENFQVSIELNSSNFDFSKAKPDGSDVRIVDESDNFLPYWIEEWNLTAKRAKIWTIIPKIPANGEVKLRLYYGNPNAQSRSDGEKVFEFFDDFTVWSGWLDYENGSVKWDISKFGFSVLKKQKEGYCGINGGYKDIGRTLNYPTILVAKIYRDYIECGDADRIGLLNENYEGYGIAFSHAWDALLWDKLSLNSKVKTVQEILADSPELWSKWYLAEISWNYGKLNFKILDPESYQVIASGTVNDNEYSGFSKIYVYGGEPFYIDWIFVRKYAPKDPVAIVGNEKSTTSETSASLTVTSNPSGAKVYVNGTYRGTTPVGLVLPPGKYSIRISKDGYREYTTTVTLSPGEHRMISATLTSAQGYLTVHTSPSGAKVYVDGKYIGTTPIENYQLSIGHHVVKLSKDGYISQEVGVLINPEETTKINRALVPEHATLTIESEPSGARVYINSVNRGKTPLSLNLSPGTYSVEVALEGYKPYKTSVSLNGGDKRTISATLTPLPASLTIVSSPAEAKVYIDGSYVGTTPIENHNLSSGEHSIKVEKENYEGYSITVTLKPGQKKTLNVTLIPEEGLLNVKSDTPNADVYVNGSYIATTPLSLRLAPGKYLVEVSKEGYRNYSKVVVLGPNGVVNLSAILVPEFGYVTINSDPSGATVIIDGQNVGRTPLEKYRMPVGTHTIVLRMDGYQDKEYSVSIKGGEETTLKFNLIPVQRTKSESTSESLTRSMESSTPTPSSTDEPSARAYGGIIPFHSGFPLIAIVLLLLGIGGIGLKFNQRRALKASYLESINLIEEAEKSSFIDETRDILVKLQELRAELDDAYKKGNREKLSRIREEISQYASTVKEIYSKYSTTKEEVINQITNILTMGSSPGAGASMGGKDREG
ncbi:DUF2341 domain-containing protein [Thermococcus gammatolerans]|uniref:LamG-like jellyroll fold domain-containing protein n=1 Tax=Thermococcus gammatolerans (strain DSM 15229 / JCM 11827 / EJ3) TaxID=593117 RepID=C5A5H2_THEGJ|nr:DUF2341 domain-containing protein [Thermococcus gammatolerans]ACS33484.1 Hypothetical protein, S-layer-like related [Thermococcus gammatolerans EJ3]